MSQDLDQRYIKIARACLNVLNNINPASDREQQIQQVYRAIDEAVNALYKQQERELGHAFAALRAISRLSPEQHQLEDAIRLAQDALPRSH